MLNKNHSLTLHLIKDDGGYYVYCNVTTLCLKQRIWLTTDWNLDLCQLISLDVVWLKPCVNWYITGCSTVSVNSNKCFTKDTSRIISFINTIYIHVGKYTSLKTSWKQVHGKLFQSVLQQVQINYIFTDTYVYCVYLAMSKCPKQLPNYTKMSINKHRSNHFKGCPHICAIMLQFLTICSTWMYQATDIYILDE